MNRIRLRSDYRLLYLVLTFPRLLARRNRDHGQDGRNCCELAHERLLRSVFAGPPGDIRYCSILERLALHFSHAPKLVNLRHLAPDYEDE